MHKQGTIRDAENIFLLLRQPNHVRRDRESRGRLSKTMKFLLLRLTSCCIYPTLLLFLTVVCSVKSSVKLPPIVTVPALLLFGDSIVDAGNNNNIRTLVKCNFTPYGKDFEGGVPTGRFCNGKVPSDIIGHIARNPSFFCLFLQLKNWGLRTLCQHIWTQQFYPKIW
ncbi:hypothetical protein Peur_046647 [Populus x canadensis]